VTPAIHAKTDIGSSSKARTLALRPHKLLVRQNHLIKTGTEMIQTIKKLICYVLILTILLTTQSFAQTDRVMLDRQIRFGRGSISSVTRGRIIRGTSHIYRVRARAGQEMAVVLKTGRQTSMTISGWSSGILEGADGVRQTVVELPETSEYVIQIGTDATANYTLEVTIN